MNVLSPPTPPHPPPPTEVLEVCFAFHTQVANIQNPHTSIHIHIHTQICTYLAGGMWVDLCSYLKFLVISKEATEAFISGYSKALQCYWVQLWVSDQKLSGLLRRENC